MDIQSLSISTSGHRCSTVDTGGFFFKKMNCELWKTIETNFFLLSLFHYGIRRLFKFSNSNKDYFGTVCTQAAI